MKNIVFLVLFSFSVVVNGQTVYYDRTAYENAVNDYQIQYDSYINFVKKYNFYKNFNHFPPTNELPRTQNEWLKFLTPYFEKESIKFDNPNFRFNPNSKPKGLLYVNFYKNNMDKVDVTFTADWKVNDPQCLYSVSFYTYDNPGKKPIFSEVKKNNVVTENINVVTEKIITKEPTVKINILKVPTVKVRKDVYIMPDGARYSYEQLIHAYPSMNIKPVFDNHFKKDLVYVQ